MRRSKMWLFTILGCGEEIRQAYEDEKKAVETGPNGPPMTIGMKTLC